MGRRMVREVSREGRGWRRSRECGSWEHAAKSVFCMRAAKERTHCRRIVKLPIGMR